jgi:type IV pilus assembly protein PilX
MMNPLQTRQRGFSLIVILLMMLSVSLLALGAMSGSVVQERMVGNARDHQVALQAAEATLRDAELDLENNIDAASGFATGCSNGLCISPSNTNIANAPSSTPLWQTVNWANTRAYGGATGAPALLGPDNSPLSAQPHYFIENLPALPAPVGESAGIGGGYSNAPISPARAYRITVRASGIRASTVVMLQSVYVKQ